MPQEQELARSTMMAMAGQICLSVKMTKRTILKQESVIRGCCAIRAQEPLKIPLNLLVYDKQGF